MRILLLLLAVVLLAGPLRRPYLRNARFTLPATVGGIVGLSIGGLLASAIPASPVSALLPLVIGGALAICFGQSAKQWCDQVFGRKQKR